MKNRWACLLAMLPLGAAVLWGSEPSEPAKAPPAPSNVQATPSVPATTQDISTPTTAAVEGDGERAQRRRMLLALWADAKVKMTVDNDPPLFRKQSGTATTYRSLPDGSPVGATLVSVAHAGSGRDALVQIAHAANVRIGATSPGMFHGDRPPDFSLDLDRKPLLEAIYETCARSGWVIDSVEPAANASTTQPATGDPIGKIILSPGRANHGLGIWSTTGPFLFELVSLNHTVPIQTRGTRDELELSFRTWTEPKLRAFNLAGGLRVQTAIDDLEHTLESDGGHDDGMTFSPTAEKVIKLVLPAHYGRQIARLSMVDHCFIQRTSSRIEMAWGDAIESKTIEGLTVSLKAELNPPFEAHATLTVARGERSELDWDDLRRAIADVSAQLLDTAGAPMSSFYHQGSGEKPLTVKYLWNYADIHGRPRTPGKVVLDLPTDVKWVDVPVELHDLPLP